MVLYMVSKSENIDAWEVIPMGAGLEPDLVAGGLWLNIVYSQLKNISKQITKQKAEKSKVKPQDIDAWQVILMGADLVPDSVFEGLWLNIVYSILKNISKLVTTQKAEKSNVKPQDIDAWEVIPMSAGLVPHLYLGESKIKYPMM